jgi:outer membrane protein assembly factor BamB
MQVLRRKTAVLFALFLMFAMAFSLVALPATLSVKAENTVSTFAYIAAEPNPVGVGQQLQVVAWVEPLPPTPFDVHSNLTITINEPGGTTKTEGPLTTNQAGTTYIAYTPTTTGTYTFVLKYGGEFYADVNQQYTPSTSPAVNVTVQEEAIKPYPSAALPTNYWTQPINALNREWAPIAGDWLMRGYNATYHLFDGPGGFNPYSQAPLTSHLMWTKPVSTGGIVGGDQHDTSYYSGHSYEPYLTPPIIMAGKLYYDVYPSNFVSTGAYPGFVCVDLRTGQELWEINASICVGQEYNFVSGNQMGVVGPYLWDLSSTTWKMYDASTGGLVLSFANALPAGALLTPFPVMGDDGTMYVYFLNGGDGTNGWLALWNSTKAFWENGIIVHNFLGGPEPAWRPTPGTYNWTKGMQWNVTMPNVGGVQAYVGLASGVLVAGTGGFNPLNATYAGYDMSTGQQIWVKNIPVEASLLTTAFGDGVFVIFDAGLRTFSGFDVTTGNKLWVTDTPLGAPWGTYVGENPLIANGTLYVGSYDGYMYGFSIATGKEIWKSYGENSGIETPYGTYPFWYGPMLANGVVYMGTGEHSPTQPLERGEKLFAFDASSGRQIWNISGLIDLSAIADGYLVGYNAYDNQIYCFGKGPSKTTVTAPNIGVTTETPVTITGAVTDISAGSQQQAVAMNFPNGLPCVSDASMSPWMEFVYMQQPCPANVTGVPVTISVLDSNGNQYSIGTAMSDASGTYSLTWTPEIDGNFTVYASFAGSESYYPSSAEAHFYASAAPTATPPPTPQPASLADIYFLPMSIGIIIAIVVATIVIVLMQRRR